MASAGLTRKRDVSSPSSSTESLLTPAPRPSLIGTGAPLRSGPAGRPSTLDGVKVTVPQTNFLSLLPVEPNHHEAVPSQPPKVSEILGGGAVTRT